VASAEQRAIKEVMVFLQGVGVSTSLAVKIYKKYGDESVETVKREPYRLAADIWGSASRPPTRSPHRSASHATARSGSRRASSTPSPLRQGPAG
jgi:ATP-dependent exoDNAse (exonuclease V) alpha subunit